jgi:hypothetical protein
VVKLVRVLLCVRAGSYAAASADRVGHLASCRVLGLEDGRGGWVEQGHGLLGEVATVAVLPLVVGLDQDAFREAEQGVGVGEDPDDVGAAFDPPFSRSIGFVDHSLRQSGAFPAVANGATVSAWA